MKHNLTGVMILKIIMFQKVLIQQILKMVKFVLMSLNKWFNHYIKMEFVL